MASLLAGIGTGLSSGIATSGGLANIMGSLVGSGLSSDLKNSGLGGVGATGFSDILGTSGNTSTPNGQQTGKAASAQDAQAPQSLSPNNSNQYTPPTYNGISGSQSPFSGLMNSLLNGSFSLGH